MLPEITLRALLLEVHQAINESASLSLGALGGEDFADVTYGERLTALERDSLRTIRLNDVQRSALLKLLKDTAAYPMLHFLSLLDGVGDPPQFQDGERVFEGRWHGVTLTLGHDEGQLMMLHDAFYDTYPRR
jgi:hypothetical protein